MKNKYIKPNIEIIQLAEQEHLMCTSSCKHTIGNNGGMCQTDCNCGCSSSTGSSKSVIWDDFEEEE